MVLALTRRLRVMAAGMLPLGPGRHAGIPWKSGAFRDWLSRQKGGSVWDSNLDRDVESIWM